MQQAGQRLLTQYVRVASLGASSGQHEIGASRISRRLGAFKVCRVVEVPDSDEEKYKK